MSSIKKNYLYQTIYQLLVIILPLITTPYISRTLGKGNIGIYSYTNTIAYYFVVFAMLGLEQYGSRKIAQSRNNKEKLDKCFSEILTLHLVSSLILSAIYIIYTVFSPSEYRLYTAIQGMYVLSAVFDINWFFFGIEKFKITVTRNIIIKIATVISVFCFVRNDGDLWKYCAIMSGSYLLNSLAIWKFVPKYVSFKKVSYESCVKHLKPLLILFVAVIAAHIYRMIDKAMLGWYGQIEELGCYEYADKIIRIPLSLITALGVVMLSRMSNLYANKQKEKADRILSGSAIFVLFMSFALSFGLAAIAPEFVVLFLGPGYEESVVLVELLAITIPLVAWNNYIRTQILIPTDKDKVYTKAVVFGAIANVIANILLIKNYGAVGAAIATILSYVIVMIIQIVPVFKEYRISKYTKHAPFFMVFGLIMFVVIRLIGGSLGTSIKTVIIEIIAGAIIYLIPSIIYIYTTNKELSSKLLRSFLKILKRRKGK